jgi:hypothetical protein
MVRADGAYVFSAKGALKVADPEGRPLSAVIRTADIIVSHSGIQISAVGNVGPDAGPFGLHPRGLLNLRIEGFLNENATYTVNAFGVFPIARGSVPATLEERVDDPN